MKKTILLLLCLALLLGGTAGCSGTGGRETVHLSFPTASSSGSVYAVGAALANLWNESVEGVQVTAEASNGGIQNLGLMASGDAQIGVAVTSIITEQKQGINTFEGHQYDGVRVLAALYANYNQIVVSGSAGIDSMEDIAGKRFAPGASGSTTEVETRLHFTTLGMDYPDGIKAQFVGFTEAVELMRNKQLDGAWIQAGLPTSAVSEMCSTAGGKLVAMPEELVDQITAAHSWYNRDYIPAGTYAGQEEDILTTSITITLMVDESVSNELVYQMTKAMWDNIDKLRSAHNALKSTTLEGAVENLAGLPLHPGAERYYREQGLLQ